MSLGLSQRAAKVIKLAKAAGVTLATVESCTAGALAVLLADAPEAGKQFQVVLSSTPRKTKQRRWACPLL